MSENSGTHINPLDLTENPDSDDREYDPVKAKLDFMLSFFSAIMGDCEITPIQKTIIDSVMHTAYRNYAKPTLREYYAELQAYEQNADEETRAAAAFLRQTLYLQSEEQNRKAGTWILVNIIIGLVGECGYIIMVAAGVFTGLAGISFI